MIRPRASLNPAPEPRPAEAVSAPPRGRVHPDVVSTVAVSLTMAVLAVPAVGVALLGAFPACGCSSQVDTTKLQMTRAAERVEIRALRKGLPSNDDGLAAVFGEELPRDSWGNEFLYITPGPDGRDFDLISFGRDGKVGGTGNDTDLRYSEVH